MTLSIIIPCLNEAATLVATLTRLQPYRQLGHEIILVDGGSQDASLSLAQPWVDRWLSAPAGRGQQLQAGALAARGEILLFLHADTQLPAQAVELISQALQTSTRQWGRFDLRLSGSSPKLRLIERLINLRSCLTGMATGDQAMFMWRSAYERAGGFPPQPLMEDLALSRRLKRLSRPVCVHEAVLTSSRRWEQRGILRTIGLMWSLRLAYFLGVSPERLARWYRQVR